MAIGKLLLSNLCARHLESNKDSPNMKRAIADVNVDAWNAGPDVGHLPTNDVEQHVEAMRKFLLSSYTLGRQVDGAFLAELCWHITKVGGQGVQDLAVNPKYASKNGNAIVKHMLGRDYEDPDLVLIKAPTWDKNKSERVSRKIPIHLPSSIFAGQLERPGEAQASRDCGEVEERYNCRAWLEHPVRVDGAKRSLSVLPCSLYWDSTQYTVRDNFFGLFIRSLRSGNQELVFIVRSTLT